MRDLLRGNGRKICRIFTTLTEVFLLACCLKFLGDWTPSLLTVSLDCLNAHFSQSKTHHFYSHYRLS